MADPSGCPDWSSLPCDLLITVLRLLDAPSALAYAGVCAAWRAAAADFAGVLLTRTPWLFSWDPDWYYDEDDHTEVGPTSATLRCLLGAGNASFPTAPFPRARSRSLRCCGSSHGWIIASDQSSNLVLYNPFAPPSAANFIALPPVSDFDECLLTSYSSDGEGRVVAYVHDGHSGWGAESLGSSFYQKAILSCAPSTASADGAAYTAAVIHCHSRSLSFAKAGDTEWRQAWTIGEEETVEVPISFWENGRHINTKVPEHDEYCDVAHHDGRFYTVTKHGTVESWETSANNMEPGTTELIGRKFGYSEGEIVLSRHLVSTPWGDLLQVRALRVRNLEKYPQLVRVRIGKIIPNGYRMVELRPAKALRGHAMFLGLNQSACVHPAEFPGLRPDCIYFTIPKFVEDSTWSYGWCGVKIYNLKNNTVEDAFANFCGKNPRCPPPAAWIIKNHNRAEISFCCSLLNLSLGD
ncbi:hypothetical protein EJB05_35501, partial [Eragrostis curvula]